MDLMPWANRLLIVTIGLLLCVAGCHTAPPPAPDASRIRDLEARIARLETQAKTADLDDEILALKVERAGLLVTYAPEHPTIVGIGRRIEALERMRVEEDRARRDRMLRGMEVERDVLLVTYSPDHDSVRELDAKIAYLRSDAG